MKTEFEEDLVSLDKTLQNKNIEGYRVLLTSMFHKMQLSNTKDYYKHRIDELTIARTGQHYDSLFLLGFGENKWH